MPVVGPAAPEIFRQPSGSSASREFAVPKAHAAEAFLAALRARPRAGLGTWPTPIDCRHDLEGRPLWVKRDDLSGFGRGGAKARKIDLLVGHLLERGHDELITVAGNVTNVAFDLLQALDRFAIKATILISDDPPLSTPLRERLFARVRDRVHLLTASRTEAARVAWKAMRQSRAAARNPFVLLPGGSHPAGVIGNTLGFLEMTQQLEALGEPLPSAVFVTAATGTTLAGFLLGERLLRASGREPVRIIGVAAYGGCTRLRTRALTRWTTGALGLPDPGPASPVEIDDCALDGGFGRFSDNQRALCDRVGERVGIAIDPIFGGKTWSAMEAHAAEIHAGHRHPLYWHCGYTPEWPLLQPSSFALTDEVNGVTTDSWQKHQRSKPRHPRHERARVDAASPCVR